MDTTLLAQADEIRAINELSQSVGTQNVILFFALFILLLVAGAIVLIARQTPKSESERASQLLAAAYDRMTEQSKFTEQVQRDAVRERELDRKQREAQIEVLKGLKEELQAARSESTSNHSATAQALSATTATMLNISEGVKAVNTYMRDLDRSQMLELQAIHRLLGNVEAHLHRLLRHFNLPTDPHVITIHSGITPSGEGDKANEVSEPVDRGAAADGRADGGGSAGSNAAA